MTTKTNRIEEICRDARELQANALEMLDQGKIRNAAEKAWGATKRATIVWSSLPSPFPPKRSLERSRPEGVVLQYLSSGDDTWEMLQATPDRGE